MRCPYARVRLHSLSTGEVDPVAESSAGNKDLDTRETPAEPIIKESTATRTAKKVLGTCNRPPAMYVRFDLTAKAAILWDVDGGSKAQTFE